MKGTVKVRAPTRRTAERLAGSLAALDYVTELSPARAVPPLPSPVGSVVRVRRGRYRQAVYVVLELQWNGLVMIPGSKLAGINIEQDGVAVISGGNLTITVKNDGA